MWRSKYLFLKKHTKLVIFQVCVCGGGGGPDLLTPAPTFLWIHNSEIEIIGRNDRCSPNIRLFDKGYKLIRVSLIVLIICSGQNINTQKGNNFYIMQKRVMVLVHCISPHRALYH